MRKITAVVVSPANTMPTATPITKTAGWCVAVKTPKKTAAANHPAAVRAAARHGRLRTARAPRMRSWSG
jgi:hypothetical protein